MKFDEVLLTQIAAEAFPGYEGMLFDERLFRASEILFSGPLLECCNLVRAKLPKAKISEGYHSFVWTQLYSGWFQACLDVPVTGMTKAIDFAGVGIDEKSYELRLCNGLYTVNFDIGERFVVASIDGAPSNKPQDILLNRPDQLSVPFEGYRDFDASTPGIWLLTALKSGILSEMQMELRAM